MRGTSRAPLRKLFHGRCFGIRGRTECAPTKCSGGMIERHGRPKGAPTECSGGMIERHGRPKGAPTEIISQSLFENSRAHGMRPYKIFRRHD